MTGPDPYDPGLQPERTRLAWRRTLISVAVVALVSVRLPPVLGAWSFGPGIAGLLACAGLGTLAGRRARRTRQALLGPPGQLPDGRLLLGLGLVVAAAAAVGLLIVALVPDGPPGP